MVVVGFPMEFDTEAQLVNLLEKVYTFARSDGWVWIREFNTPSGIADLAGVALATPAASRSPLGRIPPQWAYTLRCLPCEEPFSLEYLASLANVTLGSARLILRAFGDSGFCVRAAEGRQWIKTRQPEPVANQIVAVEAKLRDWRRALYQAAQNAAYASHSWVVLDLTALPNASRNVDEFVRRGIGLAGLSTDGELDIVAQARENAPRRQNRYWQANAEIARRLM
jgi:hypothetical protein